MSIKSMTGFARFETRLQDSSWQCEIKSVNGRNMDLRVRLPDGYEFLDSPVRAELAKHIRRGSVAVTITRMREGGDAIEINQSLMQQILALKQQLGSVVDIAPPKLEQLLALPGMMRAATPAMPDDNSAIVADIIKNLVVPCLAELDRMRAAEGLYLTNLFQSHLQSIGQLIDRAESRLAPQMDAMKKRIGDQLAAVSAAAGKVDESRIAQELALLAIKVDVREELDRLKSHIQSGAGLLRSTDAAGRKLDFLAQEFNREANTLCAKSADSELTQIGLELKNVIDQFREQVQNIE